jgi:hypothetical protein
MYCYLLILRINATFCTKETCRHKKFFENIGLLTANALLYMVNLSLIFLDAYSNLGVSAGILKQWLGTE